LNPTFSEEEHRNLYKFNKGILKVRYSKISALTGEGLDENFSWLVKELKITQNY
jgi:hypothetical protein